MNDEYASLTTMSTSGSSSGVAGGGCIRTFPPKYCEGEHRFEYAGSKRILTPLSFGLGPLDGICARNDAWLSQVSLSWSWGRVAPKSGFCHGTKDAIFCTSGSLADIEFSY